MYEYNPFEYLDPPFYVAIFHGGSQDGNIRALEELREYYMFAVTPTVNEIYTQESEPILVHFKVETYELVRDSSFYPSRDDQGQYRYEFRRIE